MKVNIESKEITFNEKELNILVKWGKYIDDEFSGIPVENEQKFLDAIIKTIEAAGIKIEEHENSI